MGEAFARAGTAAVRASRVLVRAGRGFVEHGGPVSAAAVAYWGLVSFFPLVLVVLAVVGCFIPMDTLAGELASYGESLLPGAGDFLGQSLAEVMPHLDALGLTAALALLWSASGVFNALCRGLDRTPGSRSLSTHPAAGVLMRVRALVLVLGVGLLFLVSISATAYLDLADKILEFAPNLGRLWPEAARHLISAGSLITTAIVFGLVYGLVPRRPPPWRALWTSTVTATLLFEAARRAFDWYGSYIRGHAWIYGSITTAVVLLIWFFVVAEIVLFAAELGSALSGPIGAPAGRGGEGRGISSRVETAG